MIPRLQGMYNLYTDEFWRMRGRIEDNIRKEKGGVDMAKVKTAACTCSPCKCNPCRCGKGSKSGGSKSSGGKKR